jgi:hypothetical protein
VDFLSQGQKIHLGHLECERITNKSMRLPILSYRIAAGKSGNLLYVNGAAEAEKVALQLKSLIINDDPTYKPSDRVMELVKLIRKTIHPDYSLIETLKAGVAFHYGNILLFIGMRCAKGIFDYVRLMAKCPASRRGIEPCKTTAKRDDTGQRCILS